MRIFDIILEDGKASKSDEPGVYIAVHYSKESQEALTKFAKTLGDFDIVPAKEFHTTIIYSVTPLKKGEVIQPRGWSVDDPLKVKPKHLTIFKTQSGEHALVLELKSATLKNRFTSLMAKYDTLSTNFPDYKAHITLSYDVGKDYKIPEKVDYSLVKSLEVVEEYVQPLDVDWKDKLKS